MFRDRFAVSDKIALLVVVVFTATHPTESTTRHCLQWRNFSVLIFHRKTIFLVTMISSHSHAGALYPIVDSVAAIITSSHTIIKNRHTPAHPSLETNGTTTTPLKKAPHVERFFVSFPSSLSWYSYEQRRASEGQHPCSWSGKTFISMLLLFLPSLLLPSSFFVALRSQLF